MVYLEFIELNFCGLNDNIRRNIMNKAQREFRDLSEDNVDKYICFICKYLISTPRTHLHPYD